MIALIGAETCSHSDNQIKDQHMLVVFWLSILTLIIYFKHKGMNHLKIISLSILSPVVLFNSRRM